MTCEILFGARRRARARRREARQGSQLGDVRISLWRASAGEGAKRDEVCSPATCGVLFGARRRARARRRCVPRRVSASAKARRLAALSTSGGLGRYWAAQWHLARAVGKRFRGCRAKRLCVHSTHILVPKSGPPSVIWFSPRRARSSPFLTRGVSQLFGKLDAPHLVVLTILACALVVSSNQRHASGIVERDARRRVLLTTSAHGQMASTKRCGASGL